MIARVIKPIRIVTLFNHGSNINFLLVAAFR
uniref:Uncharacterized protein n=1 Tax=Rhizophora mucronata TaxID=61149 RepID=A0A2P2PIQ5_RHIMU